MVTNMVDGRRYTPRGDMVLITPARGRTVWEVVAAGPLVEDLRPGDEVVLYEQGRELTAPGLGRDVLYLIPSSSIPLRVERLPPVPDGRDQHPPVVGDVRPPPYPECHHGYGDEPDQPNGFGLHVWEDDGGRPA